MLLRVVKRVVHAGIRAGAGGKGRVSGDIFDQFTIEIDDPSVTESFEKFLTRWRLAYDLLL